MDARHWLVYITRDGAAPIVFTLEDEAERQRAHGCRVEGPFVLEDTAANQGTVDRAREVVEAWDEWQADTAFEDPFERLKRAVTEMRVHLGEQ